MSVIIGIWWLSALLLIGAVLSLNQPYDTTRAPAYRLGRLSLVCFFVGSLLLVEKGAFGEDFNPNHREELCTTVHQRSFGKLRCRYHGNTAEVKYTSGYALWAVRWSGQHDDMLRALCQQADQLVEILPDESRRQHQCPAL